MMASYGRNKIAQFSVDFIRRGNKFVPQQNYAGKSDFSRVFLVI